MPLQTHCSCGNKFRYQMDRLRGCCRKCRDVLWVELMVRGDSMVLDGINDGELAIVKHGTKPKNGQTVVAIVDEGEATLKKYSMKNRLVVLTPANRRFKAKTYPAARVEVRGVLAGVVRTCVD
jgi:repressor LexA